MEQVKLLSVIDIIALTIIGLGTIRGLIRGLSGELAGLISIVTSLCLGLYFYLPFGAWFSEHTRLTKWPAHAVAFAAIVVSAFIVMVILRLILRQLIKVVVNPKAERLGGLIAGFLSASILVITFFMTVNMFRDSNSDIIFGERSYIGALINKCIPPLENVAEHVDVDEIKEVADEIQPE